MAPRVLKAVVTLPASSGDPADNVSNTFHFYDDGTAAPATAADNCQVKLEQFYNLNVPGDPTAHPVGYFISKQISRVAATRTDIYDMTAFGPTGSPVYTLDWYVAPTTGVADAQPTELAAAVSIAGNLTGVPEYGATEPIPTDRRAQREGAPATHTGVARPASRLRNRVYIGPLIIDAFDANTGLITNGFSELLANAAHRLADQSTPQRLAVVSKRNASYVPVTHVWCDNAPDVQRRRGRKSTLRNAMAV